MDETGFSGSFKMWIFIVCFCCFAWNVHCQSLVKAVDDASASVARVTSRAARLKRGIDLTIQPLGPLGFFEESFVPHKAHVERIVQGLHTSYRDFSGSRCHPRPESMYLNLTEVTYDYPQDEIFYELYRKHYLLNEILEARWINKRFRLGDLNPSPYQYPRGCTTHVSTLEGFTWNGAYCWVLFPWHQNVNFVRCRYPRCNNGPGYRSSRCAATDSMRPVWAFCLALPYGERITRLDLPLPSSCQCVSAYC